MGTQRILALTGVVAAAATGIGFAVVGTATGEPYKSFGVTVQPSSPAPGGKAEIIARGYRPGSEADFFVSVARSPRSRLIELGESTVDANGVARDAVTIPSYFEARSLHTIEVEGVARDRDPLTEMTKVRLAGDERNGHRSAG